MYVILHGINVCSDCYNWQLLESLMNQSSSDTHGGSRLRPRAIAGRCCSFRFMRHDCWSNVLFLHWSVPPHLESLLLSGLAASTTCASSSSCRFVLDRHNGSSYVGLVLLTEVNVGPIVGRSSVTCVTHHGANIRTYVRPNNSNGPGHTCNNHQDRGITFASLECDDALTSFGANMFGMPYQVAQMERTYMHHTCNPDTHNPGSSDCIHRALIRNKAMSTKEVDELVCGINANNNFVANQMSMRSVRPAPSSKTSRRQRLLGRLRSMFGGDEGANSEGGVRHRTKLVESMSSENNCATPRSEQSSKDDGHCGGYSVECEWEVRPNDQLTNKEEEMANFFLERYHVYTRKYGLHWRGTVTHEPWPVQKAKVNRLVLANIDQYEPGHMRTILLHMATTSPDSILFSPGVGPIDFQMLTPF